MALARRPAALVAVTSDHGRATLPGEVSTGVLFGRAPADRPDPGLVICSCIGVGVNTIFAAIEAQSLARLDEIGAALQAGTNCASCRADLTTVLAAASVREAAE